MNEITFCKLLKSVCDNFVEKTVEKYNNHYTEPTNTAELNESEIAVLADKMLALPDDFLNVLFFKYVFKFSPETTESMLDITHAKGRLIYAREILNDSMQSENGVMISDISFERASCIALEEFVEQALKDAPSIKPMHSKEFMEKLKQMNSVRTTGDMAAVYAKRAAIVVLAVLMGFAASITVNAEWREHFFNWVVETFPQFSIFKTEDSDIIKTEEDFADFEILKQYKLNYLPEGFVLSETFEVNPTINLDYVNLENKYIRFAARCFGKKTYDTENISITTIVFKGEEAFWWEKDGWTYLIWTQDGYAFDIISHLDIEEVMKIAENVGF